MIEKLKRFRDRHPVIYNALIIVAVFLLVCYTALLAVDIFTMHGKEKFVPDVRQLSFEQAVAKLEQADLKWKVADSLYNDQYLPGAVIEQSPKGDSKVKSIRTVYLTINALYPKMVDMPDVVGRSIRDAMSALQNKKFKVIKEERVASENKDLVLDVSVNNRKVSPGTPVAINAVVKLTVGDGSISDLVPEPSQSDSIIESGSGSFGDIEIDND